MIVDEHSLEPVEWGVEGLQLGTFVGPEIELLFRSKDEDGYGFGDWLLAFIDDRGKRNLKTKLLLAGHSHGATMAQAAALRLELERKAAAATRPWLNLATVYAITWGAYSWTDQR